jgi:hypothetical protein
MKIETNPEKLDQFQVTVQREWIADKPVEKITLANKDYIVTLNKQEIEELFKVIKGEGCSTLSVKANENDCEPHTVISWTPKEQKPDHIEITASRKTFNTV